ncbi:hypothetical protein FB45DRAFT_893411 [Roridomyces roridus]|uniref:Uncharacterized protein n=1 Tax=Roridomyces roridus TaxID=1738132 RepID=A0AAD7CHL0_9AGAR|nr:hypothetical protein FB45DRAFT_893411 [Roridomyces roridus]
MFARLRPVLLSLLLQAPSFATAGSVLSTSSVTYCDPPSSLLVQEFNLRYFSKRS